MNRPLNPYRKGVAAGLAYYEAFDLYRAALLTENKLPRPEQPSNPYPIVRGARSPRNGGRYQWESGFQAARRQWETRKRNGGKRESIR